MSLWMVTYGDMRVTTKDSEHRGFKLYERDDFCLFKELPHNWWYILDKNSEGYAIDFPMKMKPLLTWTTANYIWKNNRYAKRTCG